MMNTWHDVKVYMASAGCLGDEEVFQGWLDRVPAVRREKALRPKNPEVRKLSLAAGALLTCALADYLRALRHAQGEADLPGDDLREIKIAENEHGKPYLPDYPKIHFSLSHSGDRVMCAVSQTKVGCDVEEAGVQKRISGGSDMSRGVLRNPNGNRHWKTLLLFTGSGH